MLLIIIVKENVYHAHLNAYPVLELEIAKLVQVDIFYMKDIVIFAQLGQDLANVFLLLCQYYVSQDIILDNLLAPLAQKIALYAVIHLLAPLVLTHIILEINFVLVVQLIVYYAIKLHALNQL